jgi:hypothetical protein
MCQCASLYASCKLQSVATDTVSLLNKRRWVVIPSPTTASVTANSFVKVTPLVRFIHLIMQEYDSKCIKMHLITLKVFKICLKFLAPITEVNEGESNTPCP